MKKYICFIFVFVIFNSTWAQEEWFVAKARGHLQFISLSPNISQSVGEAMRKCERDWRGLSCGRANVQCLHFIRGRCAMWKASIIGTKTFKAEGPVRNDVKKEALRLCEAEQLKECHLIR